MEDEVELVGLKAGAAYNGKKGQVQGVTVDASGEVRYNILLGDSSGSKLIKAANLKVLSGEDRSSVQALLPICASIVEECCNPDGSMKRGSSESERGQIKGWMETARRACEHAVALAPAVAQTHIFLGVINDTLGDLDESLRVYDRALEALPSDAAPEVLLFKAKVVSRRDGPAVGGEAFRKAAEAADAAGSSTAAEAWFDCGSTLQKAGDHAGAIECYRKYGSVRTAGNDDDRWSKTRYNLAKALLEVRSSKAASSASSEEETEKEKRELGEEAIRLFAEIVADHPGCAKAFTDLANSCRDVRGDIEAELRHLKAGAAAIPDAASVTQSPDAAADLSMLHGNLAICLGKHGATKEEVLAQWTKAATVDPKNASAQRSLGHLKLEMISASPPPPHREVLKLRSHVEEHYGFAALAQPEHAVGQYMYGEAVRVNTHLADLTPTPSRPAQLERAAAAFRAALAHWRDGVDVVGGGRGREEVLCSLGLVLGELLGPANAEAMACYEEAIKLDPDHYPPHQYLGNELLEAGRDAEAAAPLRRCLALLGAEPVAKESRAHADARRQVQAALIQTLPQTA